jgi:hypothetical protein
MRLWYRCRGLYQAFWLHRQRDGGAEDIVGIVMPLGSGQSFDVRTMALCRTVRVAIRQEVRVAAWKRRPIEREKRPSNPRVMALRLQLVRAIVKRGEDPNEHQGESRKANGADGACHRRDAKRICHGDNV